MIRPSLNFIRFLAILLMASFALPAGAVLQSQNYIIYENINHAFDGPVISNVSASVSGQTATVSWDTNVASDAFVVYSTDSGLSSAKEQGTSLKNATAHTVQVQGLAANTVYYYRVRSERVNGGITTEGTTRSFTSGSDAVPPPVTPPAVSGGGGGILIIDKRDKIAPTITDVELGEVTNESATLTWRTDEPTTSFLEYGPTLTFGTVSGLWSSTTQHSVTLDNLDPAVRYQVRALSSDSAGNYSYSGNLTFVTLSPTGEVVEPEEPGTLPETPEPDLTNFAQRFRAFLLRLYPRIALGTLTADDLLGLGDLNALANLLPSPFLSGEPAIEIEADRATIRWGTDIEANSLVALAPEDAYDPNRAEAYRQIIGDPEARTLTHEVTLYNLTPDTTYHFQLRSKADFGPTAASRDYTFRTSLEELQITSYYTQIADPQTVTFKWVTNKEADTAVRFTPYRNGVLAVEEQKTIKDPAAAIIHELTVNEFVGGTFYEVEIVSADTAGNVASKIFPNFSTTEDDYPPEIMNVKADSTVFVDRGDKIQTIISWLTNEPATSRVRYQEGVRGGDVTLSEETSENLNYTKEHVMVITKFKPGIIYSFRVESVDSGGNVTMSKVHTFMTAKKSESIIQVILNILENTFGWLKKIY